MHKIERLNARLGPVGGINNRCIYDYIIIISVLYASQFEGSVEYKWLEDLFFHYLILLNRLIEIILRYSPRLHIQYGNANFCQII